MSKFITPIAVDLGGIKSLLPKNCHVHGATFNTDQSRVELHWEHDLYRTCYTFPLEFTVEQLKAGEVPSGVRRGAPPYPPPVITPKQVTIDKQAKARRRVVK
jgi:hypothetical protein